MKLSETLLVLTLLIGASFGFSDFQFTSQSFSFSDCQGANCTYSTVGGTYYAYYLLPAVNVTPSGYSFLPESFSSTPIYPSNQQVFYVGQLTFINGITNSNSQLRSLKINFDFSIVPSGSSAIAFNSSVAYVVTLDATLNQPTPVQNGYCIYGDDWLSNYGVVWNASLPCCPYPTVSVACSDLSRVAASNSLSDSQFTDASGITYSFAFYGISNSAASIPSASARKDWIIQEGQNQSTYVFAQISIVCSTASQCNSALSRSQATCFDTSATLCTNNRCSFSPRANGTTCDFGAQCTTGDYCLTNTLAVDSTCTAGTVPVTTGPCGGNFSSPVPTNQSVGESPNSSSNIPIQSQEDFTLGNVEFPSGSLPGPTFLEITPVERAILTGAALRYLEEGYVRSVIVDLHLASDQNVFDPKVQILLVAKRVDSSDSFGLYYLSSDGTQWIAEDLSPSVTFISDTLAEITGFTGHFSSFAVLSAPPSTSSSTGTGNTETSSGNTDFIADGDGDGGDGGDCANSLAPWLFLNKLSFSY